MKEPSPRNTRLALAGVFLSILVLGGGGFLLGRESAEPSRPGPSPTPVLRVPPIAVAVDATPRILHRGDLIALAAAAADATASGAPSPPEVRDAAGRRFELSLPFGCGGPADSDSDARMRWRYDEEAQALRLHVAPIDWPVTDWLSEADASAVEAIEGFWVTRPWTTSEACPRTDDRPAVVGTEPVTLPGQTLTVAQFFGGSDARQARRDGQPFTAVIRQTPETVHAEQGFRVRLKGHVSEIAGDAPIRCRQPAGAEQRPICMIATALDDVSIENPVTGETLATWPVAGAGRSDLLPAPERKTNGSSS